MKKILVIEDDDFVRKGIKELLNSVGYNVFSADDGKEGIEMAKKVIPDIIICDIMMPVIDGYDVLKHLNDEDITSSIPFIFLTAKAEMGDLRKGMELGADDYIVKPFESKTLLNAIETRLSKKEKLFAVKKSAARNKLKKVAKRLTEGDRIFVENSGKLDFVKVADVKFILSMGNYCKITVVGGKNEIIRKTLTQWENLLPESNFLRIHRSVIINLDFVEKISKWSSGTYKVYIKDADEPFTLSQRYAASIKNKLKF